MKQPVPGIYRCRGGRASGERLLSYRHLPPVPPSTSAGIVTRVVSNQPARFGDRSLCCTLVKSLTKRGPILLRMVASVSIICGCQGLACLASVVSPLRIFIVAHHDTRWNTRRKLNNKRRCDARAHDVCFLMPYARVAAERTSQSRISSLKAFTRSSYISRAIDRSHSQP